MAVEPMVIHGKNAAFGKNAYSSDPQHVGMDY
jgi:hypothetical protein